MSTPALVSPLWSKEKVYLDQDSFFRDLISRIHKATHSVEMETYIFESGVLAERICDALCQASQRGILVRILIDGIGSPNFSNDFEARLTSAGVGVHYYRVWPWIVRHLPGEPQSWIGQFFYRINHLNKGNHRKMVLIDRKTLWVGSANISDVHLTEVSGDKAWRDLGVCVEGQDVDLAEKAFNHSFRRGRSLKLRMRQPKLLAINQTYFQRKLRRGAQWRRLKKAKRRIWIQTPYFVPLGRVVRRLRRQAQMGVDVRILVPAQSDVWIVTWLSYTFLQMLSQAGAKIYQYEPKFVHQKLFLIDDWICLGSTNLNHRSFLHDLEIDVVITHEANQDLLEKQFLADQANSVPFQTAQWEKFPFWKRAIFHCLAFFAYWF